jgi:hypothetical protein
MHLQRSIGNRAVGQLLAESGVHSPDAESRVASDQTQADVTPSNPSAIENSGHDVQRKAGDVQAKGGSNRSSSTQPPSITKAASGTPTIQRVSVPMPKGVQLTGGNGVSVLWKKSKKSDVPHVTVGHGTIDRKKNTVPVTNFHYKFSHAGYYHWDDTNSSTTFTFRGGSPTEGVYKETSRQARKFGITLERPANLPAPQAPAQTPAPARAQPPVLAPAPDVEEESEPEVVTPQQNPDHVPDSWED